MRLSLPANYDPDILPILKSYSVFEIYGRLPIDAVGGGRPAYMGTPLSKRNITAYINAIHQNGMEFNYLLNAACYGNYEWTKRFQKDLNKELEWLSELKVETLTVSTPYLTQVIKNRFPHFKIKAGIYAQVDTVKRALYWESIGADAINLESFSINRDFEKLKAIRQAVKCDLVLIANHFCRPNCPYQLQHQNGHAHSSLKKSQFFLEYPLVQCQKNRLLNKEFFISAGWIRPEDTAFYEDLGFTTFKLLERNIPSYALIERSKAYHDRQYEGNLADILLSWGFKSKPPRFNYGFLLKHFQFWKLPIRLAPAALSFLKNQGIFFPQDHNPVTIDTTKIPVNFLDHFKHGSCLDRDCKVCGYCKKIANDAVRIEPEFLEKIIPVYTSMEDQLLTGSAWGLKKSERILK